MSGERLAKAGFASAGCIYCGHKAEEVDHIVSWKAGGSNERANLAPACRSCNNVKGSHPVEYFLREHPDALARVRAYQAAGALSDLIPVAHLRAEKVRATIPRRLPISLTLPPDLIDAVDAIAAEEDRSRAKMIEIILRRFVQEHAAQRSAA